MCGGQDEDDLKMPTLGLFSAEEFEKFVASEDEDEKEDRDGAYRLSFLQGPRESPENCASFPAEAVRLTVGLITMSRPPRTPSFGHPHYRGGPQFPTPRHRAGQLSIAPYVIAPPDLDEGGSPSIFMPNLPSVLPLGSRPFPTGAIIRVPGMPPMVAGKPVPLAPGEPPPPILPPPSQIIANQPPSRQQNTSAAAQALWPYSTPVVQVDNSPTPAPLILLPTAGGSSAPTVVPIPIPMPMPMPMPSPAPAGGSPQGPIVIAPQGPSYPPSPPPLHPPPPPPPPQQPSSSVPEVMAIMAMMRHFTTMDGAYDEDDASSEEERMEAAKEKKKQKKKEKRKRKKERAKERARREKVGKEAERQREELLKKQKEEEAKKKQDLSLQPKRNLNRRKTIANAGFNEDMT